MADKQEKTSSRSLNSKSRILDLATRERRKQRQLQALEKDNFQEDPHAAFAHLIGKHKLPTFSDSNDDKGSKRRKKHKATADHFKQVCKLFILVNLYNYVLYICAFLFGVEISEDVSIVN
jgi:zinc finger HIT domain-containing protein 1